VVKDENEMTIKGWVSHLKDQKNPSGRCYTESTIREYAQKKQHGFSYKVYPDISGEVWKEIIWSKTTRGRWEISNMSRVKYITKYAENVLSGERLGLNKGYPRFALGYCHVITFMTFFPDEYATKDVNECVLHENDDKLDFRPHKLRLGTISDNSIDAHINGCYDGTRRERQKCASYINDNFEKEYVSQSDAVRYLKSIGIVKANKGKISMAISAFQTGKYIKRYGRTWKPI
jgi:hypothetical protein